LLCGSRERKSIHETRDTVVWDQLPISQNNGIKVKLLEPSYKEDTDILKKTNENYLEWFYLLKPGEEVVIPLKYSVEYPADVTIEGL